MQNLSPLNLTASPHAGEDRARPEIGNVPTNLTTLRQSLPFEYRVLFDVIRLVIPVPESGVGLTSCVVEIIRDLNLANAERIDDHGWRKSLHDFVLTFQTLTGSSEQRDRQIAKTLPKGKLKVFLGPPADDLPPRTRTILRAARGAIILQHLELSRPISIEQAEVMSSMFAAQTTALRELAEEISLDPIKLNSLGAEYALDSPCARLLMNLRAAITAPRIGPPQARPTEVAELPQTTEPATSLSPALVQQPVEKEINRKSSDYFGNELRQLGFETPRTYSGISDGFDYLHRHEIETFVSRCRLDLIGQHRELALAAMVTLLVRCRPKRFSLLSLEPDNKNHIWIDTRAGQLCWNLSRITGKASDEVVRIPLPAEIGAAFLASSYQGENARSLADLFSLSAEELDRATKAYLHSIARTSHRPTLSRIEKSWGRYLLQICHDEVLSSATGLDLALGATANLNYFVLRAEKLNATLRKAHIGSGFSGVLATPATDDIGKDFDKQVQAVGPMLKSNLTAVIQAFHSISRRSSLEQVIAAHNVIVDGILLLLVLTTGHRAALEYSFCCHTLPPGSSCAIGTDKRVSPYHDMRVIPVPEIVSAWLTFHREWLELVAYRAASHDRVLASSLVAILSAGHSPSPSPLFVRIRESHIRPLGSEDLKPTFDQFGVPANVGRRWGDYALRVGGADSAMAMIWAGRGNSGQEGFGPSSALAPNAVLAHMSQILNSALEDLSLPIPPSVTARRCSLPSQHGAPYRPALFVRHNESAEDTSEACPFNELTLCRERSFEDIVGKWIKHSPRICVAAIAANLILIDAVLTRDEVLNAVELLLCETIYRLDEDYFVDTNTKMLGIRRVWLHPATVRLAALLRSQKIEPSAIASTINSELVGLIAIEPSMTDGLEPLEALIALARSFYVLHLPGALYAWAIGQRHARTLRPEAVARHRFGVVEKPSFAPGRHRRPRHAPTLKSDQFIRDAINRACKTDQHRGCAKTRLKSLIDELSQFLDDQDLPPDTSLLAQFAVFLARRETAAATVLRYYGPIQPLIVQVAWLGDLTEIAAQDWEHIAEDFFRTLSVGKDDQHSPDRSAFNHLMRFLGVDFRTWRPRDPAAAARRYVDQPSPAECARAAAISRETPLLPGDRKMLPGVALGLMSEYAIRPGEIAHARINDVDTGDHPHLILTREAVGIMKTGNAQRVHWLDPNAPSTNELRRLVNIKRSQFHSDTSIFLFGGTEDPRSNDGADVVLAVIAESLYRATGSIHVHPHSLRGSVLSRQVHSALSPVGVQHTNALEGRQILYRIATNAGHGDYSTTQANYVVDLDVLRRKWGNNLLGEKLQLSPQFFNRLTGIDEATYRKRISRGHVLTSLDALEGFDACEAFGARLVNLHSAVVDGQTVVDPSKSDEVVTPAHAAGIYVTRIILGTPPDVAAYAAMIDTRQRIAIDRGLAVMQSAFGYSWTSKSTFTASQIIDHPTFDAIAQASSNWAVDVTTALNMCRHIPPQIDRPLRCDAADGESLPKALNVLRLILARADIAMDITGRKSGNPQNDLQFRLKARSEGFGRVRSVAPRHFTVGVNRHISFVPAKTTEAARPRIAPRTNFTVSAMLITVCSLVIGGF